MPKFQKKVEDFHCEKCGQVCVGNGYTNHCFKCLWSKHVDIDPGDRGSECLGLMRPSRYEKKNGEMRVIQKCIKCGQEKANILGPDDEVLILERELD